VERDLHDGAQQRLVTLSMALTDAGYDVVATAADADELLRHVRGHRPDVVVTDIRMPPTHTNEGLVAALQIRTEFPEVAVMVLSQYVETTYAVKLLGDNPRGVGYLLKDRVANSRELCEAIQRVVEGGSVIDPEVVAELLGRRRERDPVQELTDREREILSLMAEGRSNQAICERLILRSPDRRNPRGTHLHQARPAAEHRRPPQGARGARASPLVVPPPATHPQSLARRGVPVPPRPVFDRSTRVQTDRTGKRSE
jgi:DNA-binding NarL/FixJ family response regulator